MKSRKSRVQCNKKCVFFPEHDIMGHDDYREVDLRLYGIIKTLSLILGAMHNK